MRVRVRGRHGGVEGERVNSTGRERGRELRQDGETDTWGAARGRGGGCYEGEETKEGITQNQRS
jgi:hypothetical protein